MCREKDLAGEIHGREIADRVVQDNVMQHGLLLT
jgi:hypothetical protein